MLPGHVRDVKIMLRNLKVLSGHVKNVETMLGQGVKSMIILKTAQNILKTKFPSGKLKMLQKKVSGK